VVFGLIVGFCVVGAVIVGISAYRSASSAKRSLEAARQVIENDLSNKQVFLSSGGRAQLATDISAVEQDANTAAATLHASYGMRILGHIPIVNDQTNGIVNLVDDVRTTASTGSTLLQRVNTLIDQSSGTTVPISDLQTLQQSMEQALVTMRQLDRPAGGLIGPIGTARRQLDAQITKITTDLNRGNQTLSYALPFLGADGPRTYLIAGENNAEMRDQGDVLSLAVMHAQSGTFDVDTVGSVDNIEPQKAVVVAVPPDTEHVFGGDQPTSLWQSVNATANFPFSALVMQAMFAQVQSTHVDGVIAMDVPALESLLALTGPVTVPNISGPISAQNVATVLLHDQYLDYPPGSAQAQRHDNIAAVAQAVIHQMKSEHIDLASLANALASDVSGRHLIVWDGVPKYEAMLSNIGASGAIDNVDPTRTFHVAVENSTATKLDYYIQPSINVRVHITPTGDAFVNTTIKVNNTTPAGLGPTFQTGPDGINSFTPGQYVSRVIFWSPRGSTTPGSTPESGLRVSQNQISVLPQQSQDVSFGTVIHHAVVNDQFTMRFVPQSRLYPDGFHVTVSASGWRVVKSPDVGSTLAGTSQFNWTLSK